MITNIFLKNIKLTPIRCCPRLISMPRAIDCDPQAVTGVSQVLLNSMQKRPSEIAEVPIRRTEYITKCYVTRLIRFHRSTFYGPEINGNPLVYMGDLIFEIRARAVRHVIKWAIPLKGIPTWTSTDNICVELAIFVQKNSVPQKFSF